MPRNMRQLIATVRSLLHRPPYATVLKWDRNQPRGPKGSPTGGQWVKGQRLADIAPGHRSFRSVAASDEGDPGQARARQQMGYTSVAPGMERTRGGAGYATIMNAPMGTGFKNVPRAAGFDPAKAAPPPKDPVNKDVLHALTNAEVSRVVNGLNDGVNVSVKVEMDDPNHTKAVYKPEAGEQWGSGFANGQIEDCITNKDLSLAEREAMASEVDRALGLKLVPTTVLRTSLDVEGMDTSSENEVVWDSYEVREMYNEYREKAQEDAMDAVGGEMADLFEEAKREHVQDVHDRNHEVLEIWEEEKKAFPEVGPYGSETMQRAHPVLPLGSLGSVALRPKLMEEEIDPLDVLDEAGVDVSSGMSSHEKDKVREVLREKLQEGYRKYGIVDDDAAKEHLDYDKFIEEHQDTEARLYESKIKTLTRWAEDMGYNQRSGQDRGDRNAEAPHPNGGSLQHFISGLDGYGSPSTDDITKLAVLDYVIGTMDRHGGNLMYHGDAPVAIDNGYSMPAPNDPDEPDDFTFRSRAVRDWRDGGRGVDGVSEEQRTPILQALQATDWKALADRHPNMSTGEREAFLGRVERMREALQTELGLYRLWKKQDLMS